ncbi:MAG: hypothetical protein EOR73_13130 [Mesorhizobium sp.]|nr:MAG: hypothetical protein EOR73_13130 [Mesorhizobium sp.]TIQ12943.1 MAG: hypothetical protein E5X57_11695 [Mesorhizobium sp.]TJV98977.1 MAG: hypothetical protein E5X52_07075 [Mesorhizobium sp.]
MRLPIRAPPPSCSAGQRRCTDADRSMRKGIAAAFGRHALGCVDIQVMPACKCRFPALPVLSSPNVRSVPVLGNHHFRRGLT